MCNKSFVLNLLTFRNTLRFFTIIFLINVGEAYSQDNLNIYYRIDGKPSIFGLDDYIKVSNSINLNSDKNLSVKSSRSFTTEEVSQKLKIIDNSVFCFGIPNPKNENMWICMERNIIGTNYNIFLFDKKNGVRTSLIDQNTYDFGAEALVPFAWSLDGNYIYFERVQLDSPYLHEGIYSFELEEEKLKMLNFPSKYMSTPLLSPNGNFFLYAKTSVIKNDPVHGKSDGLAIFDIYSNIELYSETTKGSSYEIIGWTNLDSADNIPQKEILISGFKLPWEAGKTYCVTRDGNVPATGNIGSSSSCTNLGSHTYIATDFDTPNNSDDKILSVASGVVSVANFSSQTGGYDPNGYGNWVIITHSNSFRTLYAHLKSINVEIGDYVSQGCTIGIEGNTGQSSGDHLHFEYEYPGGVSGNLYTTFDECNCIPHVAYNYTSTNNVGSCGIAPPSNDNCSTATSIISNGSCKTGTIAGASSSYGPNSCDGCGCPSPDDLDVYYSFIAQSTNHTVTVSNFSSDFDAVIELRTSCNIGSAISCYDPTGKPNNVSRTWSNLIIGNTYLLRVYEYDNTGSPPSSPNFDICVTHTGGPTASITNVTFPNSVSTGSSFDLDYSINATGTFSNNILLGASISRNGIVYNNSANDDLVSLSSGSNTKRRSFNLSSTTPSNVPAGIYDMIVALWKDNNSNGNIDPLTDTQYTPITYSQALTITNSPSCTTPGVPTSLAASVIGETTANLSWSAGSPLGSSSRTFYWVVGTNPSVIYGNGIAQGSTSGTTASVSGLSPGTTYYFRVYARTSCDNSTSSYATSSAYNTGSGSGEDITVTNASVSISSINPGVNFVVSSNHNYSGNQLDGDLPSFDLDYFLSIDCNLDVNDVLLGGDVSGLGSDDPTNSETETLTIPTGTSGGNYYILFVADSENELSESNESNNISCITIVVTSLTSCNSSDFAFLKEIYTKTNGDSWSNKNGWEIIKNNTTPPIGCSFEGLYGINATELYEVSRVSEVFLSNNNLTGTLPIASSGLSSLVTLDLSSNQISGTIHSSFGLFPQLWQLNLSQNNLTGNFPTELISNTNLTYLNVAQNDLSGVIPGTISSLNQLVFLYLHGNNFSGKLPKELGDLPNVEYMGIRDNSFSDCYDANLNKLCPKISNTYLMDNNGNTSSWVSFCSNNSGICITCLETLNHSSTTFDFSSGLNTFETNSTLGTVNLTNKITGSAKASYKAGKYILLDPGFKVDKGAVFKAENGGCEN